MNNFRAIKILFFVFALWLNSYAQDYFTITVTDTIPINFQNSYELSSVNIVPFSEKIFLADSQLTRQQYEFNYLRNHFKLAGDLKYSIFDTLIVQYESVLVELNKEYKRRSLIVTHDVRFPDSIRVIQTETSPLSSESIFGADIQRSGSIVRGFTVGSNKDFTLNSGLRLQLSGKLSSEIEIVAALTDENTPIQPEGNTERLEELDKVFIEVRHPNAIGTFGDYDLVETKSELGRINRKLQGLKAQAIFENQHATFAIASSRGKFNTNQFYGTDGNQGPYRLNGLNNERDIIVIAGSEKVYLDGEEMKRGENNDYTIEYAAAEITFTPNRLITSASRITVDFEYTDRQFQRNFIGGNFESKFFDNDLSVYIGFYRENDDENNPIDISLSDAEKKILEAAGDDRNAAFVTGVTLASEDSTGNRIGTYTMVDTLINGSDYSYYIFNPGDENSIYNVAFSSVGSGSGDYIRVSTGNYKFVGIGNGSYLPVKFLPFASTKQFGNVLISANPFEDFTIDFEFAGSDWDKNNFSEIGDSDNFGYAANLKLSLKQKEINLGNQSLGKIGLSYRERFTDSRFTTLDRFNSIEFNRDYNVQSSGSYDENLREAAINLTPIDELSINSTYGHLKREDVFSSDRFYTFAELDDNVKYHAEYKFDYVNSKTANLNSTWIKQNGNGYYAIGPVSPGVEYLFENREDKATSSDSLLNGSLKYFEFGPKVMLNDILGFDLSAKYLIRNESFPLQGVMTKQSNTITKAFTIDYNRAKEIRSSFTFTQRNKKITNEFLSEGFTDNETILIRSQSRFNFMKRAVDGDLFYEATTQKSARLERVFIRVEKGQGNYIYLGDLNNNGISDENEFEPTIFDGDYIATKLPTDELFPVIDLKANTRWNVSLDKIITGDSFIENILKPLSSETSYRLEENSRTPDTEDIYLLKFSEFLNDSNTIRGSQTLQQDLHLFKNKNDFSVRFRFIQRKSLNQFSGGVESGFFKERGVRIKFRFVEEIGNETEFVNQIDNVTSEANSNRSRLVTKNELSTDFSYRPEQQIEVGFKFEFGQSRDALPEQPTIIDNNSQLIRFTYSFAGRGRIRTEVERRELIANTGNNRIPFEITRGSSIGKNYYWRLNADYRIATNLQTSLNYDGRITKNLSPIHTLRAEARAYF